MQAASLRIFPNAFFLPLPSTPFWRLSKGQDDADTGTRRNKSGDAGLLSGQRALNKAATFVRARHSGQRDGDYHVGEPDTPIVLTAEIAASFVSDNRVVIGDIDTMIASVGVA